MLFKNAIAYHLPQQPNFSAGSLEEMLAAKSERCIGKLEQGPVLSWIKPAGRKSQVLLHEINGQRLLCAEIQKRMLPGSTVKERVEELVAEKEAKGDKVTRKEKAEFKERARMELLPGAPVKRSTVLVWWDTEESRLILNNSSRKVCELVVDLLRQTIGSLPAVPLGTNTVPQRAMTQWLRDPSDGPRWLEFGSKVKLVDSDDGVFNGTNVDLQGSEVSEMVNSGYQVAHMEIAMPEQASFVLTNELTMRGIKSADTIKAARGEIETEEDNHAADVEADFLIESDMIGFILSQLVSALGGLADGSAAPASEGAEEPEGNEVPEPA